MVLLFIFDFTDTDSWDSESESDTSGQSTHVSRSRECSPHSPGSSPVQVDASSEASSRCGSSCEGIQSPGAVKEGMTVYKLFDA